MREPSSLYSVVMADHEVPRGLPLVAGLTGFSDAGTAVGQVTEYLVSELEHRDVVVFDNDELLDWRARRPVLYFDETRIAEYTMPSLAVRLVTDELGSPFLLLSGYEPDFQWEGFTQAVMDIIERFEVTSTTWVNAIPMPVPHTRPIGVTVSGNREDLIESLSIWRPRTQVPGNALHLLEFRLQQRGLPVVGFVLLVPHYLADTEFPSAAVTALESITAATGLLFPTDRLREEGRDFLAKIASQVEGNTELARLVGTLEERHDSYMEDNPLRSPLTDEDGELPSADAIAAELEKFLAFRRSSDDDPASD
ncbi:PAC2 family protein [Microcella alkalica]|uniref:Putative ATP-grasp superfamily ATP-dependent carboligase n=1 Tax=Microcella alkalica TaxID=355930 RepID=A0A839E6R0_9MICO|nr:PAC2 family protein [Microcella alkalica]MBA8846996.1 putative ATP-grasp superfamily ATP-dependent carboligase [Microcella alkalica]